MNTPNRQGGKMEPNKQDLEKARELAKEILLLVKEAHVESVIENTITKLLRDSLTPKPTKEDGDRKQIGYCQNHPEGGKVHEYIFCHCDVASTRKDAYENLAEEILTMVKDDYWAIGFQTLGQYRTALIKAIRSLIEREGGR